MSFSQKEKKMISKLAKSGSFPQVELERLYLIFRKQFGTTYKEERYIEIFVQFMDFMESSYKKDLPIETDFPKVYDDFIIYWSQKTELEKENSKTIQRFKLESFKALVGFANTSIKSLLLANGGALIAFFTFYQTLIPKSEYAPLLKDSSYCARNFMVGIVSAILVSMFSYVGQAIITERNEKNKVVRYSFEIFRALAIASAVISLSFFAYGLYTIAEVLTTAPQTN